VARRVRIAGRVQGVFFRAWTQEKARDLGVSGWVRNCSDGSVEAHLEGEESALETLIAQVRNGPPAAQVEQVTVEDAEEEGREGFVVRH